MSNITIKCHCPFCGKSHEVEVDYREYISWQRGELAQNAFPSLTAEEREQLISGLCPKCQAQFFQCPPEPEECEPPFEDCTGDCHDCPHCDECFADDEPADIDDDCGYDPYAGCYTDDC